MITIDNKQYNLDSLSEDAKASAPDFNSVGLPFGAKQSASFMVANPLAQ